MDNSRNFYRTEQARTRDARHGGDKMRDDRFEFSSVIRGHHIYKDILRLLSERYCRAEKNQIITMIVLLWRLSKMIPLLDCASEYFGSVGGI